MPTLPIFDVKTDVLDALLFALGVRLQSLAKGRNDDEFCRLIKGKTITIEFVSPTMTRHFCFINGHFRQGTGRFANSDLTIEFKSSTLGAKLLAKGNIASLMSAIQAGDVKVTGDYKLVLWLSGIVKHATKIPKRYQDYAQEIKKGYQHIKPFTAKIERLFKDKKHK